MRDMFRYADLLQTDIALNEFGLRMIRDGASTEATARELLPLTPKYFEILSEIAWRGYLIEVSPTFPGEPR